MDSNNSNVDDSQPPNDYPCFPALIYEARLERENNSRNSAEVSSSADNNNTGEKMSIGCNLVSKVQNFGSFLISHAWPLSRPSPIEIEPTIDEGKVDAEEPKMETLQEDEENKNGLDCLQSLEYKDGESSANSQPMNEQHSDSELQAIVNSYKFFSITPAPEQKDGENVINFQQMKEQESADLELRKSIKNYRFFPIPSAQEHKDVESSTNSQPMKDPDSADLKLQTIYKNNWFSPVPSGQEHKDVENFINTQQMKNQDSDLQAIVKNYRFFSITPASEYKNEGAEQILVSKSQMMPNNGMKRSFSEIEDENEIIDAEDEFDEETDEEFYSSTCKRHKGL